MLRSLVPRRVLCTGIRTFTSQPTNYKKKPGILAYSLLVLPASCFALGCWQVGRRRWKLDLLARMDENVNKVPIKLSHDVNTSFDLPEYVPITVCGQFDHSREVLIGPRTLIEDLLPAGVFTSGNKVMTANPQESRPARKQHRSQGTTPSPVGYYVITPFELADRPGNSILVNRGWVHSDMRDPASRPDGQVKGTVQISGYIRYQEPSASFGSFPILLECADKQTQRPHLQYYSRQISEMAKELGTLPIFIDATYASSTVGGPIGGQTRINLRNEHAAYILTWFTLAAVGSGIWIARFLM